MEITQQDYQLCTFVYYWSSQFHSKTFLSKRKIRKPYTGGKNQTIHWSNWHFTYHQAQTCPWERHFTFKDRLKVKSFKILSLVFLPSHSWDAVTAGRKDYKIFLREFTKNLSVLLADVNTTFQQTLEFLMCRSFWCWVLFWVLVLFFSLILWSQYGVTFRSHIAWGVVWLHHLDRYDLVSQFP